MTVESNEQIFYLSLVIVTGVGFLKPNISTMVGSLYEEEIPEEIQDLLFFTWG